MSSKKSLADKISGLLNTAPNYTPDEDPDVESTAKVVDNESDQEATEVDDIALSSFRKQNVSLLDETDERYAGKKSSRKNLQDSDDEGDDLQPEYIDQESDSSEEDSEDENDEEIQDEPDEMENQKRDTLLNDSGNFSHVNPTNLDAINKKSVCVQNQIRMWESLLEMRIQLQKCLVASNKLPEPAVYKEMKKVKEFEGKTDVLKNTLINTLSNMLELQQLVIKKFPESKSVLKNRDVSESMEKQNEEDDEEIPSDTDPEEDEDEKEDNDQEESMPPTKKKKLSSNEIETQIKSIHNNYKSFRNNTIQTWNEKTQIGLGKKANTNPVLNQIEHNLNDKERLIKRTQMKRSEYHILGSVQPVVSNEDNTNPYEYNNNIFDDDDFYHQLLRELIEVKSADITDSVQLSRQWIQLQNLRSKMKRKIDTRATKGRKIRYGIHTKLVNFMAPIVNEGVTDDAQTELFSSLFGKKSG